MDLNKKLAKYQAKGTFPESEEEFQELMELMAKASKMSSDFSMMSLKVAYKKKLETVVQATKKKH